MNIKDIAFVCCAVSDISRARAFYEGVLGLKPNAPVGPNPYYSDLTRFFSESWCTIAMATIKPRIARAVDDYAS